MKKSLLLLSALLLAGTARAQTNVVKLDIIQPIINTLALSFEHKLSESSSFQLGVAGTFGYKDGGNYYNGNYNGNYNYSDRSSTSGFAITPEYRFYLSERHASPAGFYVAPFVRYQYLRTTNDSYTYDPYTGLTSPGQSYEASLNAFGLGIIVGKHWIFKQRFSIDVFTGPGYTFTSTSSNQPGYTPSRGNFVGQIDSDNNYDFRGGVTFGIAF